MNDPEGMKESGERMQGNQCEGAEADRDATREAEPEKQAAQGPLIVTAEQAGVQESPESAPSQDPARRHWHALYTRHQHEKVTARALAHKGFDVFLPLYNASHRWKDRTKKLALPLFPCYVFLRGGLDRRLDIVSTPGVHCLVRSGDGIAVIPENEMESVRQVVEGCIPAEPYPFLQIGDLVRIQEGSLAGLQGILVRQKDRVRLVLSVNLLRRSIAVEVDAAVVGVVSHRAAAGPRCAQGSRWHASESYGAGRSARGL